MNSGICDGGPFGGKPLHHPEATCPIAMEGQKVVTWFGPPTDRIKIFHYRFSDGRWVWSERATAVADWPTNKEGRSYL